MPTAAVASRPTAAPSAAALGAFTHPDSSAHSSNGTTFSRLCCDASGATTAKAQPIPSSPRPAPARTPTTAPPTANAEPDEPSSFRPTAGSMHAHQSHAAVTRQSSGRAVRRRIGARCAFGFRGSRLGAVSCIRRAIISRPSAVNSLMIAMIRSASSGAMPGRRNRSSRSRSMMSFSVRYPASSSTATVAGSEVPRSPTASRRPRRRRRLLRQRCEQRRLTAALQPLAARVEIDLPLGQLRRQPHVLAVAADRQRKLVFVHDRLNRLRRRRR